MTDSFPVGYHIELMKKEIIFEANQISTDSIEREHITPFIYKSGKYSTLSIEADADNSNLRICVDYPEDLLLISDIINCMGSSSISYPALIELLSKDDALRSQAMRHHKTQRIH